ncbi:hypothetical protein BH10PSE7_BH10PSE7_20270 [soil metagenome]
MATFGATAVSYTENRADGGFQWDVAYDLSFGAAFKVDLDIQLTGADPGATKAVWLNGANAIWNQMAFFSDGKQLYEVKLNVRFVTSGADQVVIVHEGSGRADMHNWYLDDPWGPDYFDQVAAHEVGHMLGNFDQYEGGATQNGLFTTGTLMSDLTIGGFQDYFWTIEFYAEYYSTLKLSTVLAKTGTNAGNSIAGTGGMDGVYALGGSDTVRSMAGNDYLDGGAGNDALFGAAGNDKMFGGVGNDTLTGGTGKDVQSGGAGLDVFDFNAIAESKITVAGRDLIQAFSAAQDRIDLSTIDAIAGGANNKFDFIEDDAFSKLGQVQAYHQGGSTFVDVNCVGTLAADLRIQLAGTLTLDEGNFIL